MDLEFGFSFSIAQAVASVSRSCPAIGYSKLNHPRRARSFEPFNLTFGGISLGGELPVRRS
jgi:hypothetical protein